MPSNWYNIDACGDNRFLQSICADKKPYFFIYVYDYVKTDYKKYVKSNNDKCKKNFGYTIDELRNKEYKTDEENDFLFWYDFRFPVGTSDCAMNRICRYMENELDGYKSKLKSDSNFDYKVIRKDKLCRNEHREKLKELEQYYCECIKNYMDKKIKSFYVFDQMVNEDNASLKRKSMITHFRKEAEEICPNDDERMNIILDMTYLHNGNRQFCWDVVGHLITKRLEELKSDVCS